MHDKSSRPARSPRRSDARKLERAVALRRTQRLTYERIAERVGLSKSVVGRACKTAGVACLPSLQEARPVRRYARAKAGELLAEPPRIEKVDLLASKLSK